MGIALPQDHVFTTELRNARRAGRLTQQALAERIGVAQATVSAWESGRQLPDDATMEKVRGVLAELLVAARATTAMSLTLKNAPEALLTGQQIFDAAREYIGRLDQRPFQVWMLGPKTLPIAQYGLPDAALSLSLWVENIVSKNATYYIVWDADELFSAPDNSPIYDLVVALRDVSSLISERLSEPRSKPAIVHIPIVIRSRYSRECKQHWDNLCETLFEGLEHQKFLPLRDPSRSTDKTTTAHDLMAYWNRGMSIILYKADDYKLFGPKPVANMRLTGLKMHWKDKEEVEPYFWLNNGRAREIADLCDAMVQWYDSESEGDGE